MNPNRKRALIILLAVLAFLIALGLSIYRLEDIITRSVEARYAQQRQKPPAILAEWERGQLLRSFANDDIKAELRHRMLALWTTSELQIEAERRRIEP